MKMKPVDPNAVIRDPVTRLPLPAEGGDVPDDSTFWTRRFIAGETLKLVGESWVRYERTDDAKPTGNEPVAPLTTRSAARK